MCCTRKLAREKKRVKKINPIPTIHESSSGSSSEYSENSFYSVRSPKSVRSVHPPPPSPTFTTDEILLCNGCNQDFSLESNKIQIHCAGCHKFYHCKIAGTCYGPNCSETIRGKTHHLSWCIQCVPGIPENNINKVRTDKCICHQCSN